MSLYDDHFSARIGAMTLEELLDVMSDVRHTELIIRNAIRVRMDERKRGLEAKVDKNRLTNNMGLI